MPYYQSSLVHDSLYDSRSIIDSKVSRDLRCLSVAWSLTDVVSPLFFASVHNFSESGGKKKKMADSNILYSNRILTRLCIWYRKKFWFHGWEVIIKSLMCKKWNEELDIIKQQFISPILSLFIFVLTSEHIALRIFTICHRVQRMMDFVCLVLISITQSTFSASHKKKLKFITHRYLRCWPLTSQRHTQSSNHPECTYSPIRAWAL